MSYHADKQVIDTHTREFRREQRARVYRYERENMQKLNECEDID